MSGEAQMTMPEADDTQTSRKCCRYGPGFWCKKYFWEGQSLTTSQKKALGDMTENMSWHKRMFVKHKRIIGLAIPALFFHFIWWGLAIKHSYWNLFPDNYFISITMIFGSIIAGMTSEGGGAIAFPVMTLAFSIKPNIARDFSLMIQSCGMSAAAFTIFFMKVQLEYHALIMCTLGGAAGMILGLHLVDPYLTPQLKKMCFVSIWFSFAFTLFLLNRYHKRKTHDSIKNFNWWKALVLFITGMIGGIFTSFAGSGLDICTFSILTLLFRVSEKVATPTSVILMAGNSIVGSYWQFAITGNLATEALTYLAVCVPIVVIGAPLGSVLGSHFHRLVLAALIYIIDIVALIGGFVLVKPMTALLAGVSVGIIAFFLGFFLLVSYCGQRLLRQTEDFDEQDKDKNNSAGDLPNKQKLKDEEGAYANNGFTKADESDLPAYSDDRRDKVTEF